METEYRFKQIRSVLIYTLILAHHLSYAIENKIKREFRGVTDVIVHIERLEIEGQK